MSHWQENLQFLLKNTPYLYNQITNDDNLTNDIDIIWDNNKRMLKARKDSSEIWLGSTMNTDAEADKLFKSCDENAGLVLVMGLGNMKLFSNIKKHFTSMRQIIIVEPSIEIARAVLHHTLLKKVFNLFGEIPISLLFQNDPVRIDNMCQAFRTDFPGDAMAVISPIYYNQLFPFLKASSQKILQDDKTAITMGIKTVTVFRYNWLINSWRNLAVKSPDISSFRELFNQLPVIIVSAGPSLNKNIHLLKEVGNKAIIISVGSATKILHNNNITPHFRFAIDGGILEKKVFAEINPDDAPLIYGPTMYYEVVRKFKNNGVSLLLHRSSHLNEYVYNAMNKQYETISSGASVANVAVFLAAHYRSKKIILMGQDLCFTDNKMYASGSWTNSNLNKGYIETRNKMAVKNVYGEDVMTDDVYWTIKSAMEDAAKWYPNSHFINATEGGLNIKGFENKRMAMVFSEDLEEVSFDIREKIKEIMNSYSSEQKNTYQANAKIIVEAIKKQVAQIKKEIYKFDSLIDEGTEGKKTEKIKRQFEKIRKNLPYKRLFFNSFSKEEFDINQKINSDNPEDKKKTLKNYVYAVNEFLDLADELAEEFLSDEEKLNIVFEM